MAHTGEGSGALMLPFTPTLLSLLDCVACCNRLQPPVRFLPCHHSICHTCLQAHLTPKQPQEKQIQAEGNEQSMPSPLWRNCDEHTTPSDVAPLPNPESDAEKMLLENGVQKRLLRVESYSSVDGLHEGLSSREGGQQQESGEGQREHTCPKCDRAFAVPVEGVSGFAVNGLAEEILAVLATHAASKITAHTAEKPPDTTTGFHHPQRGETSTEQGAHEKQKAQTKKPLCQDEFALNSSARELEASIMEYVNGLGENEKDNCEKRKMDVGTGKTNMEIENKHTETQAEKPESDSSSGDTEKHADETVDSTSMTLETGISAIENEKSTNNTNESGRSVDIANKDDNSTNISNESKPQERSANQGGMDPDTETADVNTENITEETATAVEVTESGLGKDTEKKEETGTMSVERNKAEGEGEKMQKEGEKERKKEGEKENRKEGEMGKENEGEMEKENEGEKEREMKGEMEMENEGGKEREKDGEKERGTEREGEVELVNVGENEKEVSGDIEIEKEGNAVEKEREGEGARVNVGENQIQVSWDIEMEREGDDEGENKREVERENRGANKIENESERKRETDGECKGESVEETEGENERPSKKPRLESTPTHTPSERTGNTVKFDLGYNTNPGNLTQDTPDDSAHAEEHPLDIPHCSRFSVSGSCDKRVFVSQISGNLKEGERAVSELDLGSVVWIVCPMRAEEGKLLTGGEDGIIRLWDVNQGTVCSQLKAHTGSVLSLCVVDLPLRRVLLSGGTDCVICLWDFTVSNLAEARCLNRIRSHRNWVWSLQPLGLKPFVVSGSLDCTVAIWDVSLGRRVNKEPIKCGGKVWACAAVDGAEEGEHLLVVAMENKKSLLVVQAQPGTGTWKQQGRLAGHTNMVRVVRCAHAHRGWVVSGADDLTARVWDARQNTCLLVMDHNYFFPPKSTQQHGVVGVSMAWAGNVKNTEKDSRKRESGKRRSVGKSPSTGEREGSEMGRGEDAPVVVCSLTDGSVHVWWGRRRVRVVAKHEASAETLCVM